MQPLVGLIMGSASDWETLQHAAPQGYRSGFLFFASANDKQSVGTGVEFFEKKSTPVPLGFGTFGFCNVKYERVYLKAYDGVSAARADIADYPGLVQHAASAFESGTAYAA